MELNCSEYKSYIPRSVMGELSQAEQEALDQHLVECAPCSREHQMYSETVRQLRAEQDVPVPRHFFVYPRESHATPWRAFLQMSRPWQAVAAAALIVAGLVSALAIAQLQVRSADGALVIGFGRLPERRPPAPQVAQLDTSALESRILKAAAEKNRQDSLELLRTLRAEMARSDKAIGREQRAVQDLYRTVSLERERDLAAVDNRINLLAINGEVKSTQTDAILATLLQVAELRMK
jgi:anti-sigma factor RsiW